MGEIPATKEATSKEEVENRDQTLVTPNMDERLVIRRALHVQEAPCEPSQREQIFHIDALLEAKCVSSLSMDGVALMQLS